MQEKIAVLGATGLIGSWVYKTFQDKGYQIVGTELDNVTNNMINNLIKLDIGDFSQIERFADLEQPDVFVNCVGMVGKEICNSNKRESEIANLIGVKNIARLCMKKGKKLIHFSTIVVHDGKKPTPYLEEDNPSSRPGDEYNRQKSEAEFFAESAADSIIIRVGDVYGYNQINPSSIGGNSFKLAYNSLKWGREFPVFKDVESNKTLVSDLGNVVFELLNKNYKGRINIGGGPVNNYYFVEKMKEVFNLPGKIIFQAPPDCYPTHKLLDLSKMNNLGIKVHSVEEGLKILSPHLAYLE